MKTGEIADRIVRWLREAAYKSGSKGGVVGLSGGVDSAVVAALCAEAYKEKFLAVVMPCYSSREDRNDAYLVADRFQLRVQEVVLDEVYTGMLKQFGNPAEIEDSHPLAAANIKPRLRMTTLYYLASLHRYLVIGTGNKSELYIGYFTKYGDGGVDLEPIGGLLKHEVRELARFLDVPREIISKDPTAGLWQGQTDETEMGFSYELLDQFISSGISPGEAVKEKIESLHSASEHKRAMPPICEVEDLR